MLYRDNKNKCPNCKTNLFDNDKGFIICRKCGLILISNYPYNGDTKFKPAGYYSAQDKTNLHNINKT